MGLGSNLGDRLAILSGAVEALGAIRTILAVSRVVESAPIGGPRQRDYLNAAVLLEDDAPLELLDALQGIEGRFGRERRERWGPRTLDLDILWVEGYRVETSRLVVPHGRLSERAFAVITLLEVAPRAVDPGTGKGYVIPKGQVVGRIDVDRLDWGH